jgi:hypothetical protein
MGLGYVLRKAWEVSGEMEESGTMKPQFAGRRNAPRPGEIWTNSDVSTRQPNWILILEVLDDQGREAGSYIPGVTDRKMLSIKVLLESGRIMFWRWDCNTPCWIEFFPWK